MLTRRRAVVSPLAWAAAGAASRWGLTTAQAATPMVRHNVASPDGKAMLRTYAQGVKALRAASGQLPKSWIFQWYIHQTPIAKATELRRVYGLKASANRALANAVWSTCQAHLPPVSNEPYFLPWHRLYLTYFEAIIRAVTNTPGFTLPYWDYTDPQSAALPEEFQDKFASDPLFGTLHVANRNKDDGRQFANVNAGEPLNKYLQGAENFLNLKDVTAKAYLGDTGFNQRLDDNLHGSIHVFVGDEHNMGDIPTAAGDPIFWLHHCNIDRIWYAWTAAGGENPTTASWANKSFVFADGDGKRVVGTVRSIADITALPYRYDALPGAARPPLVAAAAPSLTAAAGASSLTAAAGTPPAGGGPASPASAETAPAPPPAPASPPIPRVIPVSETTSQATAPVQLGAAPATVTLAPQHPQAGLRSALQSAVGASAPNPNQRFTLVLRGVQAQAVPGTVYKVYIDLPKDAPPDVAAQHFVGLLNFFGKVAMTGMGHAMPLKNTAFDITDVVRALHLSGSLADNTAVTLIPTGTPNPVALPVIKNGIEIRKE